MSAKMMSTLAALIVLVFSHIPCLAAENYALLQSYIWEDLVDIYISGNLNGDSVSINVSNQPTEVMDSGSLANVDVTVRTTILLDISESMPQSIRGKVIDYINYCIENLNQREELRIALFGENISIIQDFTADRYDLAKAAEMIKFDGKQSKLYDAIYNTIPELVPIEGNPCYHRMIVITDGIDEADSGITKEELYLYLQETLYPVDVVAVSESEKNVAEKDLSALTRISGGGYVNLNADSAIEDIYFDVAGITWIRAKLPSEVMDGSIRQFDVSDGMVTLQFDLKVPVYGNVIAEQETEKETESERIDSGTILTNSHEETGEGTVANEITGDEVKIIPAGLYVIFTIFVFICITLTIILIRNKNKKQVLKSKSIQLELKSDHQREEDETYVITMGNQICLKIVDNPTKKWELDLNNEITIGRNESCQVVLDDQSVSRKQCVLYLDENGCPMIKNLSSSNITQVNEVRLDAPHFICEGDQIRCGKTVLIVDSIKREHDNLENDINKMTHYVNV